MAVMVTLLATFGAACHRAPHVRAGNERQPGALFPVLVGPTSSGAKGTAGSVGRSFFGEVDRDFIDNRLQSGFGSGESLIDAIRDPGDDDDAAPRDTRLVVVETEYARLLKVAGREGSTTSMVMRDAWDSRPLQARSRARTSVASNYHLALIGHVTPEELRARLTDTETYGGWTNRFTFFLSHRTQLLPDGGNVPDELIVEDAIRVRANLITAKGRGELYRTPAASDLWRDIYLQLADDQPDGLFGAMVARAAPYVLRFSLVYALSDGAHHIDVGHLDAGYALWRYARLSAEVIFGDTVGDEVADQLLKAIRKAGTKGLDLTDQSAALGRNVKAARLAAARKRLEDEKRIKTVTDPKPTGGRAPHRQLRLDEERRIYEGTKRGRPMGRLRPAFVRRFVLFRSGNR